MTFKALEGNRFRGNLLKNIPNVINGLKCEIIINESCLFYVRSPFVSTPFKKF